ncbi:DUF4179 domain-containing protein [Wukongibacter baidiensis]|uniref:DUF4179 domain-containing protein n=1 Tax=Wukongibacter baidiensis TaxID=1723361 RepID=UPI003D7F375D
MKEVEKILNEKKLEIEQMEVPDEMEKRLKDALKNKNHRRTIKYNWKAKAAVAVVFLLLVSYNFDTLAFYTKRLIGYEGVMNGTLNRLNESGKGQLIGKSYTFENGVTITLDGIMLDDNKLITFYTIKDPRKKVNTVDLFPMVIKGRFGEYFHRSSIGEMNDEKTELKYMSEFEKPRFFEKKLSLSFNWTEDNVREEGEVSFMLDRNKAMGHTLKKAINKSIKVDETKIRFKSILASPTSTIVKGDIQDIVELVKDHLTGERFRPDHLEVDLIANGEKVQSQGSSMSTDLNGITFEFSYDALPVDLEKLQIKVISFSADHDVEKKIELNKGSISQSVDILGQNIEIKDMYESKGDTYITICTQKNTVLTRVYLIIDGESVELDRTIADDYIKREDGTILHTRTLRFPGNGEKLQFDIKRMTYEKIYNKTIDIDTN